MRFSIEAEQSVIGGLLIDPERICDVTEILNPYDFYDMRNRILFAAICDMSTKTQSIDPITLSEKLNASGDLERIGGVYHIVELINNTPSASNIKAYAQIVAERAIERRITELGQKIADLGGDETKSADEKLEILHENVSSLERRDDFSFLTFGKILKSRVHEIDSKFRGAAKKGIECGFKDLDARFQGLGESDLWVLAARPSMGKTALAMNVACNVAAQGRHVLVFTCEMTKEQLADRMISSVSGVPASMIKSGQLTGGYWDSLSAGVLKLRQLHIHIIDMPALDIHRAKAIARKFKRSSDIGLIVVDYLQLMTDSRSKTRFDEVSSISRELKAMAKTIGCPVLALSQLSRGVESQVNKRPGLKDLRESGQIEQDADIITFIYRDEYYHEDSPNKGLAEIITAKFRNGEVGTDILKSELHLSRFSDVDFSNYKFDWKKAPVNRGFEV